VAAGKGGPKRRPSAGGTPGQSLIFLLVLIVAGIATMIGTDSKKPRLAIDLDGGTSVTLTATSTTIDNIDQPSGLRTRRGRASASIASSAGAGSFRGDSDKAMDR